MLWKQIMILSGEKKGKRIIMYGDLIVEIKKMSNHPIMERYLLIDGKTNNTLHSGTFGNVEVMFRSNLIPKTGLVLAENVESAYYDTLCRYDDKAKEILNKYLFGKDILWRLPKY